MGSKQFCLRWNNHQNNLLTVFDKLLSKQSYVDVTLACEGSTIKAHKMILSACSPFFDELFDDNPCKHPIIIMRDMKYSDLKAIVHFMYKGEVNVSQEQLSQLLKTAEALKIKGLAEMNSDEQQGQADNINSEKHSENTPLPATPSHPITKKRRDFNPMNVQRHLRYPSKKPSRANTNTFRTYSHIFQEATQTSHSNATGLSSSRMPRSVEESIPDTESLQMASEANQKHSSSSPASRIESSSFQDDSDVPTGTISSPVHFIKQEPMLVPSIPMESNVVDNPTTEFVMEPSSLGDQDMNLDLKYSIKSAPPDDAEIVDLEEDSNSQNRRVLDQELPPGMVFTDPGPSTSNESSNLGLPMSTFGSCADDNGENISESFCQQTSFDGRNTSGLLRGIGCPYCPQRFTLQSNLSHHIRHIHSAQIGRDIVQHQCRSCKKIFRWKASYKRHIKLVCHLLK